MFLVSNKESAERERVILDPYLASLSRNTFESRQQLFSAVPTPATTVVSRRRGEAGIAERQLDGNGRLL